MRNCAAQRRLFRHLRIDMDELMIVGGIGEFVDPLLIDRQPSRNAEVLSDQRANFIQLRYRHHFLPNQMIRRFYSGDESNPTAAAASAADKGMIILPHGDAVKNGKA